MARGKREKPRERRGGRLLLMTVAAVSTALLATTPTGPAALEPLEQPEAAARAAQSAPVPVKRPPDRPRTRRETPVEDGYFAGAVFLGDSRTEGFHLYSGLTEGTCLYAVGATVTSVFSREDWPAEGGGKVPLLDALAEVECSRVYLMLGVNELGWPDVSVFTQQYGRVIDRVRQDHPEAEIAIQSILPVSAKQDARGGYVNNRRVALFNESIRAMAAEKGCVYLDVASAVTGADGCLPAELTGDGIHLNVPGCKAWLDYLKLNPL